MAYNTIATQEEVQKTADALKANGITVYVAADAADAKQKIFTLIPEGSEIMTMTSVTLTTLGLDKELNDPGKYKSVRQTLTDLNASAKEKRMLGAAPEYTIGSVHAVTQDGKIFIASNTGSQLPAYAYGAGHVIWVVGTQKVAKNSDEAIKRIYEYVLPLESERANKAYNITTGSFVSKLLIVNREVAPGRITVVFVPEILGF